MIKQIGISVQNLDLRINGNRMLWIRKLECRVGETLCVVGANGAGKSLFLEALCGNFDIGRSVVFFEEKDGERLPISINQVRIGAVLQRMSFWPLARISELIHLVEKISGREIQHTDFLQRISNTTYKNLSTGEKQYFHFCLFANSETDLLFLDEPRMGLDACIDEIVLNWLSNSSQTKVMTLHNFADVLTFSDCCLFICNGIGIPMKINTIDSIQRQAIIKLRRGNDNDILLSKQIELDTPMSVARINSRLIPLFKEFDGDFDNLILEINISRGLYEEYHFTCNRTSNS